MSKPNKKKMKHSMAHRRLVDCWVKNAEGRKASLLADLKGGEFRFPKSKTTFMLFVWDKLISEIKQATTLEGAYQAFLTFHDVVDESLAIAGGFHKIWKEFMGRIRGEL